MKKVKEEKPIEFSIVLCSMTPNSLWKQGAEYIKGKFISLNDGLPLHPKYWEYDKNYDYKKDF